MSNIQKIDTLNRTEFIDRVVNLVEIVSANKGNITFAIDGEWGCGKTFVLEKIEEKLKTIQSEETASDKYFVIHYNCWEYDYYDEPLFAIVSAIIDELEKTKALKTNTKATIKRGFKGLAKGLLYFGNNLCEKATGINGFEMAKVVTDSVIASAPNDVFDEYSDFKNILVDFKENLKKICDKCTIVLCVDELDRCMPDYAIKVLERLHHITEELNNAVTIISTDEGKLKQSIRHSFGFSEEDMCAYLQKFIKHTFTLDVGENNTNILDKYKGFIDQFRPVATNGYDNDIVTFITLLFDGIPIREQELIFEKVELIYSILNEKQKDYTVLCTILYYAVLVYHCNKDKDFVVTLNTTYIGDYYNTRFLEIGISKKFNDKVLDANIGRVKNSDNQYSWYINNSTTLFGVVIYYINNMFHPTRGYSSIGIDSSCIYGQFFSSNKDYIQKFVNTLFLIK